MMRTNVNCQTLFKLAVTWNWGRFLNAVLNLILVGFFLFLLVKRKSSSH